MPPTVNTVEYVGGCREVNFGCFQPSKAIQEKCEAWLFTSSYFQDTLQGGSNPSQVLLGSPHTRKVPQLHEHLSRVSIIIL